MRIAAFLIAFLVPGCSFLDAVMQRSDVGRLMDCSNRLPDYTAAAVCLGAEAATQGFRLALDEAVSALGRAQHAEGSERESAARELAAALDRLAAECRPSE